MNKTSEYFNANKISLLKKEIKQFARLVALTKEESQREQLISERINRELTLKQLIIKGMKQSFNENGFNLTRQEISEVLDISEEQVRKYIIPFCDYIDTPEGSVDFFSLDVSPQMKLMDMRILKWKKLFIKRESFYDYLRKKLLIPCPYSNFEWYTDEKGTNRTRCIGEGVNKINLTEGIIQAIKSGEIRFKRKANIADVIVEQKREAIFRKSKNEINNALRLYHLGLEPSIDVERHEEEIKYAHDKVSNMKITVYNGEIEQALKLEKNVGQFLRFELMGIDGKTKQEKIIAVLYWISDYFKYK